MLMLNSSLLPFAESSLYGSRNWLRKFSTLLVLSVTIILLSFLGLGLFNSTSPRPLHIARLFIGGIEHSQVSFSRSVIGDSLSRHLPEKCSEISRVGSNSGPEGGVLDAFVWRKGFIRFVGLPCNASDSEFECHFPRKWNVVKHPLLISSTDYDKAMPLCSAVCRIPRDVLDDPSNQFDVVLHGPAEYNQAGSPATFTLCKSLQLPWVHLAAWVTVKDEALYLPEWLEYVAMMGVGRVYVYDNNSTDNTWDILAPFVDDGFIVRVNWPYANHLGMQHGALHDAFWRFGEYSSWLMCVDPDEFPVPTSFATLTEALEPWDKEYVPAVGLLEFKFGTSGHQDRPKGLVLEHYVRRMRICDDLPEANRTDCPGSRRPRMYKMIVNTRHAQLLFLHWVRVGSSYNLTQFREPAHYYGRRVASEDVVKYPELPGVRLHHYKTKSVQDWMERRVNRVRASGLPAYSANMRQYEDHKYNEVEDRSAVRFADLVRQRLVRRYASVLPPLQQLS